jgi:hypothetical protein
MKVNMLRRLKSVKKLAILRNKRVRNAVALKAKAVKRKLKLIKVKQRVNVLKKQKRVLKQKRDKKILNALKELKQLRVISKKKVKAKAKTKK